MKTRKKAFDTEKYTVVCGGRIRDLRGKAHRAEKHRSQGECGMKYQFTVNITDQDYVDYNIFWSTRSPYGKKQITNFRLVFAVCIGLMIFMCLWGGGFSAASFAGSIPFVILLILVQVFAKRIWALSVKGTVQKLKDNGKMGYSPRAVIEFFEDSFVETTDLNTTEQKYSAIERISKHLLEIFVLISPNPLSSPLLLSDLKTALENAVNVKKS